ncbi:hypothetical protein MIND_00280200 [Mycena indigotica]|uniref:Uncharacterized protein n=1 Tax=Mycena indigotica TaxID=2126181 RepID=A0A8H6T839_9AGAR|nr:uncharacterized protein MIND_00280200 [Mycena indigotica]KAF7312660.1 hypothetical protein MIND_00280200 [Mycena indigotica]
MLTNADDASDINGSWRPTLPPQLFLSFATTTMSSSRPDRLPPATQPIPIAGKPRPRSMSVSSSDSRSTGSPSSPTTPPSVSPSTRINIPSPASSPILSYFLAQSPTKTPGSFPFRKFGAAPPMVFEEDESDIKEVSATHHARRASTAVAERLAQPGNPSLPDAHHERGQGVMRRLSLSGAFMSPDPTKRSRSPPTVPPNSAVSPTQSLPFGRDNTLPRRSATLSAGEGRPRRAPSPMGERILKGHFDGFN